MDPLSLGLGLGVAAVSTGIGIAGSNKQNKAASQAAKANQAEAAQAVKATQKATALQISQLRDQTELERNRASVEIEQVRGRVRVAQADSGLGMGGSALALERQLAIDAALNDEIRRKNLASNIVRVQQGLEAETAQTQARLSTVFANINSNTQSPFLSALSGGIQGLGTGLAIAGATKSLFGQGGAQ